MSPWLGQSYFTTEQRRARDSILWREFKMGILWHYVSGPLLGFQHRIWPQRRSYPASFHLTATLIYFSAQVLLWFGHLPRLPAIGLALILFSPQWLYVLPIRDHPVFEYRGYSMAAGVALILAWALPWWAVILLCIVWFFVSMARYKLFTSPDLFWARVEEENRNGP